MGKMNRRTFLRNTTGALAASAFLPGMGAAEAPALTATTRRTLGKSGLSCSLLGIGTGTRGRDGATDQTDIPDGGLTRLLEQAYERGITYFDMADRYGSHKFMREAMKRSIPRDKVMLLTKIWNREPEKMRADIERIRKELDTDWLDVALMHCLREGEDDWPETLKASMDVLSEAKAKGFIRAHGVSCHRMGSLERVAGEPWADVVLVRVNPFSVNMDGPVETVVPVIQKIHDAGKGVLGMKILGEGNAEVVAKKADSLKFALGLGTVDAMTIGFMNTGQLDEIIGLINKIGGNAPSA